MTYSVSVAWVYWISLIPITSLWDKTPFFFFKIHFYWKKYTYMTHINPRCTCPWTFIHEHAYTTETQIRQSVGSTPETRPSPVTILLLPEAVTAWLVSTGLVLPGFKPLYKWNHRAHTFVSGLFGTMLYFWAFVHVAGCSSSLFIFIGVITPLHD